MSYKIGVISDTHGLLRDEVREHLQGCEMIIHAGDIQKKEVLVELERIAVTYAVRGNADKEWAAGLPRKQELTIFGVHILIVHNKKHIDVDLAPFDLIVYGHSHQYEEKTVHGKRWLDPGSCGPRRFSLPITMAMLFIEDDGSFDIRRIDIPHTSAKARKKEDAGTIKAYLPSIMQDIDKGMTVEKIAKKYHISKELAEQVCRLYLTHPGVDADGIMGKMGI